MDMIGDARSVLIVTNGVYLGTEVVRIESHRIIHLGHDRPLHIRPRPSPISSPRKGRPDCGAIGEGGGDEGGAARSDAVAF